MAEIKIEKKKPVWPWILVIIILGLLGYFFWQSRDNTGERTQEVDYRDTISTVDRTQESTIYRNEEPMGYTALDEYTGFLDKSRSTDSDTQSAFHREALQKLIAATREQSIIQEVDVDRNLEEAEENANKVTHDVNQTAGVQLKKAAEEISSALKKIQEEKFKDLEPMRKDVEKAVSAMNGMKTIDDQQEKVNEFHAKARALLDSMYDKSKI